MANEQTSVPLYAASEVLTAANMNISAGTGVPVFATTVTRDAAFGGANEKVLAEGQLCYLSASNIVQYYDGAAWATVGPAASALTLTGSTTVSAAASCSVTSCFSSTYDNYLVIANFTSVTGSAAFRLRTSSDDATTNYGFATQYYSLIGGGSGNTGNAYASSVAIGDTSTSLMNYQCTVRNPNNATTTNGTGDVQGLGGGPSVYGWNTQYYVNTATQYTGITFLSTTLTGTARVYGYALS